jgi:S1-C subfamily serine protease
MPLVGTALEAFMVARLIDTPGVVEDSTRLVANGTIPEYGDTAGIKGVKLNGVAKGGPAAQAGLEAGDVIIQLAGKTIENIYDYTHALQAVKVGQPITVEVLRDGKPATFTVTPASRD